ncbi:hypothetical protein ACFQY7_31980 [Actinomadura luteofluorescens]|uniref:hypothetical protein n=1 Tax=Actinomadura luteofluorescens TaxID=46163 RepID=UPI00362B1695
MPFDPYRLDTVTVGAKPGAAEARPPRQVKVLSWGTGKRRVEVDAATASFLTVNENFNAGWRATVGGTELRAVRLDGWKQGWVVPKGTRGVVELAYTPDRAQRTAVVAGLSLLLVLLLVAVRPSGRRGAPPGAPRPRRRDGLARVGGDRPGRRARRLDRRAARPRRHGRGRRRLRLGPHPPLRRTARPRLAVAGRARHARRGGLPRRRRPARQPGGPVRPARRHRPAAARPRDRRAARGRTVAAEAARWRFRRPDLAQLDGARAGSAGRDGARRRVRRWTGHSTR